MNTLVTVTAQLHENYGTAESPHWKPKGAQQFFFRADSDHFLYIDKDPIGRAIQAMIDKHMAQYTHTKCTYVEHELIFSEPIELKQDFSMELNRVLMNEA
jgi:hypothetical protein